LKNKGGKWKIMVSIRANFFEAEVKALLYTAPYRIEYTDVPEPTPAGGEVLVRVMACGICGSDAKGYTGKTGRRKPPLIMGHEASGVVERAAPDVSSLREGERVALNPVIYCRRCSFCKEGKFNICEKRKVLGVSVGSFRLNGAMAEKVSIPSWQVHRIPEGITFEQATLLEPASVALHAVRLTPFREGATVVVIGAGVIGLFVIQAAKLKGAGKIIAVDLSAKRLEVARALGADHTLNPQGCNIEKEIKRLTRGKMAEATFEAVGTARTFRQAIDVTRSGGDATFIGNAEESGEINFQTIVTREIRIQGVYGNCGEYGECIELVDSGKIKTEPLISRVMPLSEGARAFEELQEGKEELLKIVLVP